MCVVTVQYRRTVLVVVLGLHSLLLYSTAQLQYKQLSSVMSGKIFTNKEVRAERSNEGKARFKMWIRENRF